MAKEQAPRTCIPRILPDEFKDIGLRKAREENESNQPQPGLEAAVLKAKVWRTDRTLRIAFLDGDPTVQARVRDSAEEWRDYANINFEWVSTTDADIRISFEQAGSWSALGTDALVEEYFKPDEPTMNYGWLTTASSDQDIQSVVLHEFGHALGMIHEHSQPDSEIKWNNAVVERDLGGPPNFWSPSQVQHNVFRKYSEGDTNFTEFDSKSIMLYFFPAEWTLDGQAFSENVVLSDQDKSFMAQVYPGAVVIKGVRG